MARIPIKITGVNDGQAFMVGPHLMTPGMQEDATEAKYAVLAEAKARLDAVDPVFKAAMQDGLVKDAVEMAGLAEFHSLVYNVLCKVDHSLVEKGLKATIRDINYLDLGRVWAAIQGRELNEAAIEKAMDEHVKAQEKEAQEVLGQAPLVEPVSEPSSGSANASPATQ